MYLHLGQDIVVHMEDVVGVFDLDTSTVEKITRDYLAAAERAGDVIAVTTELPKSFVLCRNRSRPSGRVVYLSQISSVTLRGRSRAPGVKPRPASESLATSL